MTNVLARPLLTAITMLWVQTDLSWGWKPWQMHLGQVCVAVGFYDSPKRVVRRRV